MKWCFLKRNRQRTAEVELINLKYYLQISNIESRSRKENVANSCDVFWYALLYFWKLTWSNTIISLNAFSSAQRRRKSSLLKSLLVSKRKFMSPNQNMTSWSNKLLLLFEKRICDISLKKWKLKGTTSPYISEYHAQFSMWFYKHDLLSYHYLFYFLS